MLAHGGNLAAQTNSDGVAKPGPPTGLYVLTMAGATAITLGLSTNGDYEVHTDGGLAKSQVQGKWQWDDRLQEFLLTPSTNSPDFGPNAGRLRELRRLRVDRQETDTLQWIPLHDDFWLPPGVKFPTFRRQPGGG